MRQKLLTTAVLILLGGLAISVTNLGPSPTTAKSPAPARLASSLIGTIPVADPQLEMAPPAPAAPDPLPANQLGRVREVTIGRNETFHGALQAHGVSHGDVMRLVKAAQSFRDLQKVKAGEVFRIELDPTGALESLTFDFEVESWVRYRRHGTTFEQELGSYPVERRVCGVSGIIRNSLFETLAACDAPADLGPKITDVLGWDLNFDRDIKRGDTFRVLYEEVWKDGEFVRTGPVLACAITNAGREVAAYQFATAGGTPEYYDASGKSLQKSLIRAPLNYSRISSNFSFSRLHPVHKRVMPHMGVDYAAPVGTPVWAAGSGVIAEMGHKGGNGRYIRIAHSNREYETMYLHFSRFAAGMKKGRSVRQGEVIGYVGASGWATGPHLDFRVKHKGRYVDPRKLKLPAGAPVPASNREEFAELRDVYAMALGDLPVTGAPRLLPELTPMNVPHWDAEVYAARAIPADVRAAAD